jgi:hypothetical protein
MEIEPIDRLDCLETGAVQDRRRPGRSDDARAELIPMLRGSGDPDVGPQDVIWESHLRSSARGVLMGLLISAIIFGTVGLPLWIAFE